MIFYEWNTNIYYKVRMIRDVELLVKGMEVNDMITHKILKTNLMQVYGEVGRLQDVKQVSKRLKHRESMALSLMRYFNRRYGYEDNA